MQINVTKVQTILANMGKYKGNIDGIWGAQSEAALNAAYEECKPASNKTDMQNAPNWATKWFSRAEFRCKCGGKFCTGFPYEPDLFLMSILDRIREHFGVPVVITSGVRCKAHNANVGGVANSKHLYGKAADFYVKGFSSSSVLAYVSTITGVYYCYAIDGNTIHVDVS